MTAFYIFMAVPIATIPQSYSLATVLEGWFLWVPFLAIAFITGRHAYKVSKDRRPVLVISVAGIFDRRFKGPVIP